MNFKISAKSFLFLALAITLLFSCKKEDDDFLEGDPTQIEDPDHNALTGQYGINALFPKEGWTNSYLDTFPEIMHSYYDKYRSNAVFAARKEDKIGDLGFDSEMYLMRFYMPASSASEAKEIAKDYKSYLYDAFPYYQNVSNIEETKIGRDNYEASYFEAQRTPEYGEAIEHVYIIYNNKTLYGVNVLLAKDKEEALDEFLDILKTLKLD